MPTVIRDDSIGQALGTLASGIMGNPKDAWEAQAYKQRIAQVQAETAKSQLEMQEMRRQHQAQSGLVSQFNTMFQPGNFNVPETVEAPRPAAPGFQGPMRPGEVAPSVQGPMPGMHNPQADNLDQKLAFARAAATNAVMRGGNPNDALSAAYAALGMGQVLASGVPTNELGARQTQTMLTGQIPDAKVALTEDQRLTNVAETEAAKLKEAVAIGANGTLLTPQQAGVLNVPADANGQYIVRPPADPAAAGGVTGPFGGTSMEAQANNIILSYQDAVRNRQPISPQMEAQARIAWNTLYGTKDELRSGPNGSTVSVPVTPRAPDGFVQPGSGAPIGSPTGQRGPATSWQPQPGAAPVSAPPAPVSGAPVDPNAPRVVIPGTPPKDIEAVQRKRQFVDTMKVSKQGMDALLDQGNYVPSFNGQILNKLATRADGTLTTDLVAAVANGAMNAADQQYWTAAGNFLNAVLRDESGAAVPEQEYPRYLAALIPQSGDSPERIAQKRMLMQAAIEARENAFLSERPGAAREVAAMIAASPTFQPEAAVPAAGSPDRVRLRQEADDAIARIEASNLPSSAKMQKKALIEQKFNQMTGGQ
jgi:hypothetical protein